MDARERRRVSPDLRVCLPPRTHVGFMQKSILSPGRSADSSSKRFRNTPSRGQSSPMFRSSQRCSTRKGEDVEEEPTSPKVTCAGQIKVRPTKIAQNPPKKCRNWQSVMEEMERMHQKRSFKKSSTTSSTPVSSPSHAKGFGNHNHHHWNPVFHVMSVLRSLRVDLGCFGPPSPSSSYADENDEEIVDENSRVTAFAKWFMVLEDHDEDEKTAASDCKKVVREESDEGNSGIAAPPPNALLLMRCRSAPSQVALKRTDSVDESPKIEVSPSMTARDDVVVRRCADPSYSKLSLEVSKETWLGRPPLMRSLSLRG